MLRSAYHESFEIGKMQGNTWFILDESVAHAIDHLAEGFKDWEYLRHHRELNCFYKCALKIPLIKSCAKALRRKHVLIDNDCYRNFIDCHHEVSAQLSEFQKQPDIQDN
jgi:hypothetical protein